MIQLYPKGQAAFTNNGIDLHPVEAEVTWQDAGRYDFTMSIPKEACEGITFDYGQILKVTVPTEHVGAISLGTVSYYETTGETPLYSQIPKSVAVSYNNWEALRSYMAGDKVTYDKKNWRCVTGHGGLSVPPPNGGLWTQIAGSRMDGGKIITTLASGTSIMKVRDFNATYMEAATLTGLQGYLKAADAEATGESESRTIPAFTITEQLFTINTIDKETNAHMIRIEAEHISYQLGRTILDECNVVGVNPATALRFIAGAMQEEYAGGLYTNITDGEIEADWSWKNAQSAILDPQSGLLQFVAGRAIRDNLDVYIIPNAQGDPEYEVRYGVNMKSVKWTGDVTGIVTRIYPIAQREDGTRFTLPEKYIDSVLPVPYIRPEVLDTKLKIGQKVTNSDGTEVELTENEVLTRMRDAAQNRFSVDKCDQAEVTLELDWIHMPDTEEYRQYISLQNAAPADWVTVTGGPMGIETVIQMTGYAWDPILGRYKKTTFGDKKQKATISGFNIKTGAVSGRALAAGAVSGQNIQAGSITAREIEANSITAEQIASRIITAELVAAEAITANEIAAQAITTVKLAAGSVTAEKIAAGAVTADSILAGTITSALIAAGAITAEQIAANAVTADKIAAGAVTATKIDAYAITSEKIAAGAIDAGKIAAGAIDASKIDTTDLAAINATLGTAAIAIAEIQQADIDYAQVKDLNAQSAFFGQAVFQEAIGGKLYVPRLSVGYAQMIGATIGDLVIQASNGNFYGIDVDLNGNVTATQRTVSAGEIAAGHTSDGRTLVLGTDILATDLTTENIYASHALMDEITAAIINVDQLFAREATISKINALDLSSNTYIRSTIGTWTSGSTITQTINSLDSRISSLGYGTVYFQADEPDHADLLPGDIWIQSTPNGTWQDVLNDYATWNTINNSVGTWQTLGGIPKMYTWDGRYWQEMYDALLPTTLETEIEQLADQIALRATREEVDILSGEVSEFSAELTIQAQEIEAAVSAVNAKAATYVMTEDPRGSHTITLGDIWIRTDDTATWNAVQARFATWNEVLAKNDSWMRLIGSITYVWDGSKWVETSDRANEIYQRTLIDQTQTSILLMAGEQATLQNNVINMQATLQITAEQISSEVSRATTAENGKIDKTASLQTADQIVNEAVSQAASAASGAYIAKTTTLQTATQIVSEAVSQAASAASGTYIAKTTNLQTADAIKNEAVRLSGVAAADTYIAKTANYANVDAIIAQAQTLANNAATTAKNASIARTSTYQTAASIVNAAVAQAATAAGQTYIAKTASYQTADAIVNAAKSYVDGELTDYSTTTQTSTMISQYVGNNAYTKQSGIAITADGIDMTGNKYIRMASGSQFKVASSGFNVDSTSQTVAMWIGNATASSAPFRVTPGGEVTLTKLMVQKEDGTEEEFNLYSKTYGLWKLEYSTVKRWTVSGDSVSIETTGGTINFNSAGSVGVQSIMLPATATADVSNKTLTALATIKLTNGVEEERRISMFDPANGLYDTGYDDGSPSSAAISSYVSDKTYTVTITRADDTTVDVDVDCSTPFDDGYASGSPASGTASGRSGSSYSWTFRILKADSSGTNLTIDCSAIYSDARSGYTLGIFSQYSGAQLYTIGQSGPERYTGTLYTKA